MKSSSALSFRQLANKIHPQIALTRVESTRLLDTLKTSFRHHLDVEHGSARESVADSQRQGALNHTERHVASVLTNPLLIKARSLPQPSDSNVRHPIDIFDDCVARGLANVEIATRCISAFQGILKTLTPGQRKAEIAQHQPGSKVLRWLWATDLARSEVFVSGQHLASAIVALLLREGKEAAIWNWLATADVTIKVPVSTNNNQDKISCQASLLKHLIFWKIKSRKDDLNLAATAFATALGKVKQGDLAADSARPAGLSLLKEVKRQLVTTTSNTPRPAYVVPFLQSFSLWKQTDTDASAIDVARLSLQHIGSSYIDTALATAKALDIDGARTTLTPYGTKVIKFLVALSEVLHTHGSRAQVRGFLQLLESVQAQPRVSTTSVLSRGVNSFPKQLLEDVKSWSRPLFEDEEHVPG